MKMNASKREYGYTIRACMQGMRIDTRDRHTMRDLKLKEAFSRGEEQRYTEIVQGEAYDEAMNAALDTDSKIEVAGLCISERKGYWAVWSCE